MTPREIETALGGMVVLVDTREQDTPRLRARLKEINCPCERHKLDFGDYSAKFPLGDDWLYLNVAIERKMDFGELAQCFCKGRARFAREFDRAKAKNAKIYLLIENCSWEDAYTGIFCSQRTSGKLIHDILHREGREMLERMMLNA